MTDDDFEMVRLEYLQACVIAISSVPGHKQPSRFKNECPDCLDKKGVGFMVVTHA